MKERLKLYNDATSPFGRKVLVAAIECQIALSEVFVDLKDPKVLEPWNPTRQIPTLVLPNGSPVFDSNVIVQYLDTQNDGSPLIPSSQAIPVLVRMSLADGLMETTLKRLGETRRNQPQDAILNKLEATIWRALGAIEAQLDELSIDGKLQADHIATAAALGYVDLRFTTNWREKHPAVGRWFESISARRSMIMTAPSRSIPLSISSTEMS